MKIEFKSKEKLYRAIRRWPKFIKKDGTITRAAFKYTGMSSNGCSVDRQLDRSNEDSIKYISRNLEGLIASIKVEECQFAKIFLEHSGTENDNPYHSELFQNPKKDKLNDEQLDFLAINCFKETK